VAKRWERSVFHPALAMKGVVPKDILEFGTLRPGRSFHEGGSMRHSPHVAVTQR
jgi:hypothetical protein